MANRILRMNGESNPIGRRIEAPRAEVATPDLIRAFLELFERTRIRLNIRLADIYNMDETGIALGVCTITRVLADSRKRKAYIKSPENREWVSIIESISADGQKLRCLTIFKGKSKQTNVVSIYITCYNQAREEGLSDRVIRAGWKGAGLCPFDIDLVFQSSQIIGRPITPPPQYPPVGLIEAIYRTPQGHRDIYQAQQALQQSESLSRSTRLILHNAAKAISRANMKAAKLEADNQRLKYQLNQAQPQQKRKRVAIDPNQRFAEIDQIKAAVDRSAAEQARSSSNSTGEAAAAADLQLSGNCNKY